MALEARVRDAYRLPSVTAFGGREYVKGAWRPVPDEQAGSAGAHSFLEVREVGGGDVVDAPPASTDAPPAPSAVDGVDGVDRASPEALDETQGTPPEGARRAPARGAATGGARRGKS